MEDRLNDGRIHPDGAGELLAGQSAAVLPEDLGDLDALRLRELRDTSAELALAFRIGFRMKFSIAPLFQKDPGVSGLLLRQVLFPDE